MLCRFLADGFDPWACEDAEFIDSYYSAGDDCVAVKSGKETADQLTDQFTSLIQDDLGGILHHQIHQ